MTQGAKSAHKTGSDFVWDAAFGKAPNALLDETAIRFDEADWDRFIAALAAPASPNPRLRDLMSRKPVWES